MLNFNRLQKFHDLQKMAHIARFTHFQELNEKTVNAIVAIGVTMYLAFILYREYNGLA